MPLIASAITLACANISQAQNHQDACQKVLEASAKSTQLYNYDQKAEDQFTLIAKNKADNYVGKSAEEVFAGMIFVYRDYRKKSADLKLPNMGLCDRMTAHVEEDKYSLGFNWSIW